MNIISEYIPQKGGRFYTLAKSFKGKDSATPKPGSDNWLSDMKDNSEVVPTKEELDKQKTKDDKAAKKAKRKADRKAKRKK